MKMPALCAKKVFCSLLVALAATGWTVLPIRGVATSNTSTTYQNPPGGCAITAIPIVSVSTPLATTATWPNAVVGRGTIVPLVGTAEIQERDSYCNLVVIPLVFSWSATFQGLNDFFPSNATGSLAGVNTLTPTLNVYSAGTYVVRLTTSNPYLTANVSIEVMEDGIRWVSVGPSGVDQAPVGGGTVFSGRVNFIAFDPRPAAYGTMYLGTAGGGVWKSTDLGQSWRPVTDNKGLPSPGIGAVAIARDGTVYAGTGDPVGSGRPGGGYINPTGAVYKSQDGGGTWTPTGQPGGPLLGAYVKRILIDPSGIVYVASQSGVFRSSDRGASWVSIRGPLAGDVGGNLPPGEVYDLALDPADAARLYIVRPESIYSTTNANASPPTWTRLLPWGPCSFEPQSTPGSVPTAKQAALAVASSSIVYASYACELGPGRFSVPLFYSPNRGTNWWRVPGPPGDFYQSHYNHALVVNPMNVYDVFLGDIDVWRFNYFAYATGACSSCWTNWGGPGSGTPQATGRDIHADTHALAFDPVFQKLYAATDGGLHSYDLLSPSLGSWRVLNNNLALSQFFHLGVNPNFSGDLIGGLQDNGTLRRISESPSWYEVWDGDGHWVGIDARSPSPYPFDYCSTIYFKWDNDDGVGRGKRGCQNYSLPIGALGTVWTDPFRPGVMLTRSLPFWSITPGQLYYADRVDSPTGDTSFTCVDPTPTRYVGDAPDIVTAVAFPRILPSASAGVYYVGTSMGQVYMVDIDAQQLRLQTGSNCSQGTSLLFRSRQLVYDNSCNLSSSQLCNPISGLAADPASPCILYALDPNSSNPDARVIRISGTSSGGTCGGPWTPTRIAGGLPTTVSGYPVKLPFGSGGQLGPKERRNIYGSVAVEPTNSNLIYVGTDAGLFSGQFNGSAWTWARSLDVPDTIISGIKAPMNQNGTLGTLYASTFGRGVYERIFVGSGQQASAATGERVLASSNNAPSDKLQINKHNEITRCLVRESHDPGTRGRVAHVLVDYAYKGDKGDDVWLRAVVTTAGTPVPHFIHEIRHLDPGAATVELQVIYGSSDAPLGLDTDGVRAEMFVKDKDKDPIASSERHFTKTWRREEARTIEVRAEDFRLDGEHGHFVANVPVSVTLSDGGLVESHSTPFHLFVRPGTSVTLEAPVEHDTPHLGVIGFHQWLVENLGVVSEPRVTFIVWEDTSAVVRYAK